ncbi:VOC family protein [Rheinheimera oceanensis]|uniref:VOC family protein n=1 Tax=Rheinheimera oceanensis TaxID=2817449 RepID=UPI001BFE91DF|nr:hypothetical protein [Rheinheimera oceanensis]
MDIVSFAKKCMKKLAYNNRLALLPGASAPAIISCAIETKQEVDLALERAKEFGGAVPAEPAVDPSFGGYIGYVSDPEGHLWELVCPAPK